MKPEKELTEHQKKYCEEFEKNGRNRKKAMLAVNPEYKTIKGAMNSAARLHNQPHIKKYLQDQLNHYLEKDFSSLYNIKICTLIVVAMKTLEKEDYRTTVSAINELNKMCGDHAPEKRIDIIVDGDQILKLKELYEQAKRDY